MTPPLPIHAWLRFDAVLRLLRASDARTILEIGVGQGSFGVLLAQAFEYTGIDLDDESLSTARKRFARHGLESSRLIHGGTETVEGRTFDLVCAFEVLEHFEDDGAAVSAWAPLIAPGGALLLSVPAGPGRFGPADSKAGHFRRYSRQGMEELLLRAGFSGIRILNYGVPAGYVLETVRNVLARRQLRRQLTPQERTLASGRWMQPPDSIARLTHAAALPLAAIQRPFMNMDIGTGLVALGFRN